MFTFYQNLKKPKDYSKAEKNVFLYRFSFNVFATLLTNHVIVISVNSNIFLGKIPTFIPK